MTHMHNGLERPPRYRIGGIPLDPMSCDAAVRWVINRADGTGPMALVATVNLDFFALARAQPTFAKLLRDGSALNVIDGWPVAWLLRRRTGAPAPRASGSDLAAALLRLPAMRTRGIYLLGDTSETLHALRERGAREGWIDVVRGMQSPPREALESDDAGAKLVADVNASKARVLLVAFGTPRQELWLARWADRLAPPVGIGVGGSLKFVAWPARRAPAWMRRCNLEWLHRLGREPARLGPRYAKDALELGRLLWHQLRA